MFFTQRMLLQLTCNITEILDCSYIFNLATVSSMHMILHKKIFLHFFKNILKHTFQNLTKIIMEYTLCIGYSHEHMDLVITITYYNTNDNSKKVYHLK